MAGTMMRIHRLRLVSRTDIVLGTVLAALFAACFGLIARITQVNSRNVLRSDTPTRVWAKASAMLPWMTETRSY